MENKNKNLGLEILRTILCFWVVMIHCSRSNNFFLKYFFKKKFHVPTFMIISFYFFFKNISLGKINKIKERIIRITFPYIMWPLIIFIINNFFFKNFGLNIIQNNLSLKKLLLQFLFGRVFYRIFWFQFNLIFLTLLFSIIYYLFINKFLFILQIFGIISYYFQYSYLNYNLFSKYQSFISYSLGTILEMLPFSIAGFTFGSINLILLLSSYRKRTIFFSLIIIIFLFKYDIFMLIKGFFYPGIELNLGATFLFSLFSIILVEPKMKKKLYFIIGSLTKYTGGIYYLHILLRNYLKKKILLVKNKTISGSIIIYIICYFICFIGIIIFKKTKLKYLFY